MKIILRDIFWMTSGRWGLQFFSITLFFFSARLLSTNEFGKYSLIMALLILSEFSAREIIENFFIPRKLNKKSLNNVRFRIFIFSIAFAFLLSFFLYLIMGNEYTLSVNLVFFIIIIMHSLAAIDRGILIGEMKAKSLATATTFSALISTSVAIILLLYNYGYIALIIHQLLLWIGIFLSCRLLINNLPQKSEPITTKEWQRHAFLAFPSAILTALTNRSDVFILSLFFGSHHVGVYAFTKRVLELAQDLFGSGIERYLVAFQSQIKNQELILYKLKILVSYLVLISTCGFAILAPLLLPLLFGNKWEDSYLLFYLMAGGSGFAILVNLERSKLYAEKSMEKLLKAKFLEFFISLLIMLTLGSFSYLHMGAAFSLRFFAAFGLIFIVINGFKAQRTRIPSFFFLAGPNFLVIFTTMVIFYTSKNFWLDFLVLILVSIIIFLLFWKKDILKIVRNVEKPKK